MCLAEQGQKKTLCSCDSSGCTSPISCVTATSRPERNPLCIVCRFFLCSFSLVSCHINDEACVNSRLFSLSLQIRACHSTIVSKACIVRVDHFDEFTSNGVEQRLQFGKPFAAIVSKLQSLRPDWRFVEYFVGLLTNVRCAFTISGFFFLHFLMPALTCRSKLCSPRTLPVVYVSLLPLRETSGVRCSI